MLKNGELKLVRSSENEPAPDSLSVAIIDSADDAVVSKNLDGIIQTWNKSAERIFGYTADEMIGKSITLLIPQDRISEEVEILERIRRGERVDHYETVRVTKDGRRIPISLTISPIRDSHGNIVGASKIARDITARADMERIKAHFAAIVESADDAIVSKTPTGIIESWNKGAEHMFGYSAREMIGRSILVLIPPDLHQEEADILAKINRGERIDHYETTRVTKDGRRIPISLSVSPIKDARGKIIGVSKIARDISERVAAQHALKEAERRKNEFLAMLAHELRNPLTPIRTGIDLIQRNLGDQKRREWALQVVDRQLVQLSRIIDDLLELAVIVNGQMTLKKEMVSLRALVTNAVDASRRQINTKNHNLWVDLPLPEIELYVDPARMGQVLCNLLSNAAKYTEPGGTISLYARATSGEVTLIVKDSGRGIDARLLPHIFDPFVQGNPDYARTEGGLGIGLSIVRRIVEMHGGSVGAVSKGPNSGSEFTIKLPLPADTPTTAPPSPDTQPPTTSRRRILIVDDNRDVADMIAEYLTLSEHEVARHYEGEGVVELARSFQPDVILLDLGLPGRNGFEIAHDLRAEPGLKDVPLIAISGYGQAADMERTRAAGFNFHVLKPVDTELLMKLIEAHIAPSG